MKICVKRKHINEGKPKDCYKCPIGLALEEQTDKIFVIGTIAIHEEGSYGLKPAIKLPKSAQRFISKFDYLGKKAVKPFNFILDI